MDLNQCTYRVNGIAKASLVMYCSKSIHDVMFQDLVPATIIGISSTYCNVSEDDVEIEWEQEIERLHQNLFLQYPLDNDEPETMTFRAFDIVLGLSFSANGVEVDSETFLDNLYISVDFTESIHQSMYSEKGFQVRILEGKIQPFDFKLTVL